MTDEEILQKAIKKAVKNGWEKQEFNCDFASFHNCPEIIIFNHDFAKAFWGEEEIEYELYCEPIDRSWNSFEVGHSPSWQYHLQKMVLEENPISYLAKFL